MTPQQQNSIATADKVCSKCGIELNEENWYPSLQKKNECICKECKCERVRIWRKANPEKAKVIRTRRNRKRGMRPFSENKKCTLFLGIHVAERVLSLVFKDVKRMPMHNPGYDVICNKDKMIDIKSSCLQKTGIWQFHIRRNTVADYFLCLAFDNREDLNPLYAWLIPGSKLNHLRSLTIRPSTTHKWDAYRIDLSKISDCCDALRGD